MKKLLIVVNPEQNLEHIEARIRKNFQSSSIDVAIVYHTGYFDERMTKCLLDFYLSEAKDPESSFFTEHLDVLFCLSEKNLSLNHVLRRHSLLYEKTIESIVGQVQKKDLIRSQGKKNKQSCVRQRYRNYRQVS